MRLHSRTQQEHLERVQNFYDQQQLAKVAEALRDAFNDYFDDEPFQAWCCGFAFAADIEESTPLMEEFLRQYPLSLYPVKVDLAEQLITKGQIDSGANEARHYLALLHENELPNLMQQNEALQDSVARAFLLLSSVYTEIAARSYSKRLFAQALELPLDSYWNGRFQEEIQELDRELQIQGLTLADNKWEEFFRSGAGEKDLKYACEVRGFPILRKRLELLGEQLRAHPDRPLNAEEIYQLVYQTEEGAFTLV